VRKLHHILALIFFLSMIACAVFAQYYADIRIDISESGLVTISGTTNHPLLKTGTSEDFTSKSGRYWLFKIDINEVFSDFVYSISLPENASINYIKVPGPMMIENDLGRLSVKGTGHEKPFQVIIQYSVDEKKEFFPFLALIAAVAAAIVFFIIFSFLPKKRHIVDISKDEYAQLTERQLAIVKVLKKHNGVASQKTIVEELGLPKSSVSRNVEALIKKGYIRKEEKGITNTLILLDKKMQAKEP